MVLETEVLKEENKALHRSSAHPAVLITKVICYLRPRAILRLILLVFRYISFLTI